MTVIEMHNVQVAFGDKTVVSGASFQINQGKHSA